VLAVESVAVIVKLYEPGAFDVPLNVPSVAKFIPGGNAPDVT
jgi:predicted transcriptional regulator YheO